MLKRILKSSVSCTLFLSLSFVWTGILFSADSHAGSDPKSTIVASARSARSNSDENDALISLPGDSGKGAKQTKTASQTIPFKAEDSLPGVIYDFSRTAAEKPTDLLDLQNIPNADEFDFNLLPFLKKYVLGNWTKKTRSDGKMVFSELSHLYSPDVTPYRSFFYKTTASAATWGQDYTEKTISQSGYCVIHSGYVVAPFTGKFRFVGYGNDVAVIRFNRQIVLDYGCFSLTLGKQISGPNEYSTILEQKNKGRLLPEKDIYSGKLETYFQDQCDNYGIAKGPAINVVKGQVYPVDILYVDIKGANSAIAIFVEQLDSRGEPLKSNPKKLPLFRTSSDLPDHPQTNAFPDFDENSPIWQVVDSKGKRIPAHNQANADASAQDKKVSEQPKQETKTAETKKEETPKKEQNLIVTTAKDVVSASDKVVSLTEALKAAAERGGKQTISFNVKGSDKIETSSGDLFNPNIVFDTTNAATGNEVTVLIRKSKVEGRTTNANGGMICGKLNVDISELTGQNNTTHGDGGLLHLNDSVVNIRKSVFSGNSTPGPEHGGGTGYFENCTVTVEDCSFSNGQAYHGGGALYFHKKSIGSVKNCTFTSNHVNGYAGAVKIRDSEVTITDSVFENNSTGYSTGFRWSGGAIQIEDGHLIYTVSSGKTIVNTGNHGTFGGFVTISHGTAVFNVGAKGSLTLGTGKQADDYDSISTNFGDEPAGTSTITKRGKGTMTINAATSPFNGNWIVEDGVLNMNYGGNFAGAITVNGGRMDFSKDYTFTTLAIGLDAKKKDAYIGGASHLSGGKYCIVIDNALPKGSYPLAEDAKGFNAPVTVQTKDGETLGSLVAGRITKICEGNCMLKLDGGTLSLSVFAAINPPKKANAETEKQNVTKADSGKSSQEKQTSSPQPQRDPNLKKTVTKSTRGNVTTETVTEYNGDTTIETVTTTEVNGNTTTTTKTITETKNGAVVKKTTTTTTTMGESQSTSQSSSQSETKNATDKSSTESNTTQKKNNPTHNPFGYTSPLMED